MNLLDLFVKISVDDQASRQMDGLTTSMIAKAQVMADGIRSALSTAWDALSGVVGGAVGGYSDYQQLTGGMETFFGKSADTVISNAKRAYETAGMSANDYMSTVTNFAMSLVQSVAKRRVGAVSEAARQETAVQAEALDQQASDMQAAFDRKNVAAQRSFSHQATAYADSLQDQLSALQSQLSKQVSERQRQLAKQLDQLRDELDDEVKAQQKADEQALSDKRKALDREVSQRSKALAAELKEFQRSQNAEVKAFQRATDARIAEIDREYTERLKLTDEEEYRRLKEIDAQIDALDAQAEAEEQARKDRENGQRLEQLRQDVANAKFVEDRAKAEQELADFQADLAQEGRDRERKGQRDALTEQRERIREEYSQRKEAIREEESQVVDQYRESRSEELDALREHQSDELDARREHNAEVIDQMREENAAVIDQMREDQSQRLDQMREHNAEAVAQRQEENAEEIAALQEHNQRLLTERQRANRDALTAMQESQQDQLSAMRSGQQEQLAALRDSAAQQRSVLDGMRADSSGFVQATSEDQAEAARIADMAIMDMADNANRTGVSMESLQYAYQGFAKQNFTMLDNLGLGFAGSQEGMEDLLRTAEDVHARNGEMVDYSITSFADVVEAIHTVQEAYGITGTTAAEASHTVQGSFNQMQASWRDFLVTLGDPDGDVDKAMDNLLNSIDTYLDNVIPIVSRVLDRLIPLVVEKGQVIAHKLWDSLMNAIPEEEREKLGGIVDTINNIVNAAINAGDKIPAALAVIGGVTAFNTLATTISNAKGALDLLMGALGIGGGAAAAAGGATLAGAAEAAGTAAEAAAGKFTVLEGGLSSAGGAATAAAGEMAGAEAAAGTLGAGLETVAGIAGTGITGGMVAAGAAILALGIPILKAVGENEQLMESIKGVVTDVDTLATDTEVQTGTMTTSWSTMGDKVRTTAQEASDAITVSTGTMTGSWKGAVEGMANDTETNMGKAKDSVKTHTDAAKSTVETNAKESKDSWVSAWKEMYEGTDAKAKETKDRVDRLRNDIDKSFDGTEDMLKPAGANIMTGFWNGLVEAFNNGKNFVTDIATWIKNNKGPEEYDRRLLVENGQWIMEGLYSGIQRGFETDIMPYVGSMAKAMEGAFGSPRLAPSVNVAGQLVGAGRGGRNDMPRQLNVILELDRQQFGHLVYNLNSEETQRVGVRTYEVTR